MQSASSLWEQALGYLKTELNEIQYSTWMEPLEAVELQGQTLYLQSPNSFHRDYSSQYLPLMENTLRALTREDWAINIITNRSEIPSPTPADPFDPLNGMSDLGTMGEQDSLDAMANAIGSLPSMGTNAPNYYSAQIQTPPKSQIQQVTPIKTPNLAGQSLLPQTQDEATGMGGQSAVNQRSITNPNYTFETFVLGGSNRFAQAACIAVAENQGGRSFNPLFIYSGSGMGKTHLMHAIANYCIKNTPERKFIYVQSEQFVNEFIYTIRKKSYDAFRLKYRHCDLLLIDDIQFIEGKEQMQIEFFHTFNELYENNANIVMTCDQPPQSLNWLEERLRTRFSSGLIVDIQPPDYETRVAILENRAFQDNVQVPSEIIEYIATHINSNIRELEGAYKTVMAYASLTHHLDLDLAKEVLKDIITPTSKREVNAQVIIEVVARYYEIKVSDMLSKVRNHDIAYPRQIAMYLCREILNMTYADIGKALGGRDHTTVIHAHQKITKDLEKDGTLAEEIAEIRKRVEV